MTTWATFLKDLREDLQDTGGSPRWSNYLLYVYSVDAIRDYSIWFPYEIQGVTLAKSGTGYALPADFIDDISVECPADTFLERRRERPGIKYLEMGSPYHYNIRGSTLYVNGPPSDTDAVILTYFAYHPIPTSEKNKTFNFTIPDVDLELLRLYAKAQVHGQMRGKTARLDRFEPGSGRRDDNPLKPESDVLMNDYYSKISYRLGGKAIKLHRPGRVR
jgi:hypothetical protein